MIDTDKYEGHTPAPWRAVARNIHAEADWSSGIGDIIYASKRHGNGANARLIADAPLLLAEVKRLREALINVQRSLVWDEKDRAMFGEPITLEALFTQVEQVRSDITEMIE